MIPKDDEAMKKIIKFRINFFLYGPRASGKTYYLKGLLDQMSIPYIYLNCTFADKKVNFFKLLNHELDKFFIGRLSKIQKQQPNTFQSMMTFAISKNQKLDKYQDEEDKLRLIYPQKGQMHNVQSWIDLVQNLDLQLIAWLKEIYIFMDNIQELNVSPNFLTNFYYSCQQEFTNFKIPFIFCGINLPRKIYSVDKPFRNITSFCMRRPEGLMKTIINDTLFQFLKNKYKNQLKNQKMKIQELERFSEKLTRQIYAAFQAVESDLNKIKKISQVIVNKVCEGIDLTADNSIDRYLTKAINNGDLKQIIRQMTQQGPINDFIVTRRLNQKDQEVSTSEMSMEYYPMLLLTSIHLADHAQQKEDPKRFKDYKNMKRKQLIFDFKTRKHNLQRIISISESLQTSAKQNDKEKLLKHHSLDYFGCIQHLKQQKKISSHGKAHSFISGKLFGSVRQDEVLTFMRKNNLSYTQFTGIFKDY